MYLAILLDFSINFSTTYTDVLWYKVTQMREYKKK